MLKILQQGFVPTAIENPFAVGRITIKYIANTIYKKSNDYNKRKKTIIDV